MATALTAWFRAPAPTASASTPPDGRTTPAMAPATELGFERLDTLRISTGPPDGRDLSVPGRFDSAVDASCPPIRPFFGRFVPHTLRGRNRAARQVLLADQSSVMGSLSGSAPSLAASVPSAVSAAGAKPTS